MRILKKVPSRNTWTHKLSEVLILPDVKKLRDTSLHNAILHTIPLHKLKRKHDKKSFIHGWWGWKCHLIVFWGTVFIMCTFEVLSSLNFINDIKTSSLPWNVYHSKSNFLYVWLLDMLFEWNEPEVFVDKIKR